MDKKTTSTNSHEDAFSRRAYLATVGAATTVGLAGCTTGGDNTDNSPGNNNQNNSPASDNEDSGDDDKRLVVAVDKSPSNLDPGYTTALSSYKIINNTNDRLFTVTKDLEVVPELAKEIQWADDGSFVTIPIEEGVTFHDGSDLTASDIIYTFERLMKEETSHTSNLSAVEEMEADGDHTVVLHLSEPLQSLTTYLANFGMDIVPEDAKTEDLKSKPMGSGPYKFEEWVQDDHVTLTKFEDYWGDEQYYDEVVLRLVSEGQVRVTEIQSGNVEFLGVNAVPTEQVEQLQDAESIKVDSVPSVDYRHFSINCSTDFNPDNPLADENGGVKFRQAIAEAMDYNAMLEGGWQDYVSKRQAPLTPSNPWYLDYAPYSYEPNLEKAQQLLDESGVETPTEILIRGGSFPRYENVTAVLQQNLKPLDINLNIELYEWGTFLNYLRPGKYDMAVWGWTDWADPDAYLRPLFHSEGSYIDRTKYHNERVDELLEQGKVESDTEKRREIYNEVQKILTDELPFMWIGQVDALQAWRSNISGTTHPHFYYNYEFDQISE